MISIRFAATVVAVAGLVGLPPAVPCAGLAATPSAQPPKVVEVPSRPAWVKLPGRTETAARPGQSLPMQTVLRTETPGRMQVQLGDGRSFRLGGNALLRLVSGRLLDLQRGQIIAWVNPGRKDVLPLRLQTRVGTASIEGTTVFIEASDDAVRLFSWEGAVRVLPDAGEPVTLRSGEQLSFEQASGWQPVRRLTRQELDGRRARSILLKGFNAPMETLPVIERELGFSR